MFDSPIHHHRFLRQFGATGTDVGLPARRGARQASRARIAARLLAALVLCGVPVAGLAAGAPDEVWNHPRLEQLRPREIALLPVVGLVDEPRARRHIENRWMELFSADGHRWRSAGYAGDRMAAESGKRDSVYDRVARQVRETGRVDSTTAAVLSRIIGAQSIMIVRLDRWERVSGRAMVEMTATLLDSAGRLLWRSTGAAETGTPTDMSPAATEFKPTVITSSGDPVKGAVLTVKPGGPVGTRGQGEWTSEQQRDSSRVVPDHIGQDFKAAVGTLLMRWGPLLPKPPTGAGGF